MTIGLGIIGAGIMGERMLRAALEHAQEAVHIARVWDASPDALARIDAALPGTTQAASAEAVVAASDCVYIATPPATHLGYARMAQAAGKAVFLEKPLAVDIAEARGFVEEASRNGAFGRTAVNFPFASSLAIERLRGWLDEGAAGVPRGFEIDVAFARWPRGWQQGAAGWLDGRAEGGFTREVVSHFLFLARRLFGPLHLQSSEADYPVDGGTERRITARLDAGGLPGTLAGAVGATSKEDHNTFTVHGIADLRLRDWSIAERGRPSGEWVPDEDALPNERMRPLVLRRQLEGVARMTRGEPHHLATLSEAYQVQEIVEAILTGHPAYEVTRRD